MKSFKKGDRVLIDLEKAQNNTPSKFKSIKPKSRIEAEIRSTSCKKYDYRVHPIDTRYSGGYTQHIYEDWILWPEPCPDCDKRMVHHDEREEWICLFCEL